MTAGTRMARPEPPARIPVGASGRRITGSEWRLPSGQDLISFALATGFAAGPLLNAEDDGPQSDPESAERRERARRRS